MWLIPTPAHCPATQGFDEIKQGMRMNLITLNRANSGCPKIWHVLCVDVMHTVSILPLFIFSLLTFYFAKLAERLETLNNLQTDGLISTSFRCQLCFGFTLVWAVFFFLLNIKILFWFTQRWTSQYWTEWLLLYMLYCTVGSNANCSKRPNNKCFV